MESTIATCVDQGIEDLAQLRYCSIQRTSAYGDDDPYVKTPMTAGTIGLDLFATIPFCIVAGCDVSGGA